MKSTESRKDAFLTGLRDRLEIPPAEGHVPFVTGCIVGGDGGFYTLDDLDFDELMDVCHTAALAWINGEMYEHGPAES